MTNAFMLMKVLSHNIDRHPIIQSLLVPLSRIFKNHIVNEATSPS